MPILRKYSSRCLPSWSEKELEHKLKSASEWDKYDKPRGYLIGGGRSSTPIKAADPPPRVKKKISPPWLDPKTRQPKQAGIATVAAPEDAGHRDGAISGPNDPEARFLANLIHTFGATYTGRIQR